ncbi:MAG: DUF4212 domain-containing protein [Magnetococcales bacterium]|nr:DUF4212 domain-containing protein [Magnetococcales bacterium]
MSESADNAKSYWRANLKLMSMILAIWFLVSFVFGLLLVDVLNMIQIGGYPLGFWFAQQGSIFTFVGLVFYYVYRMNKLDKQFNVQEE